jgi:hypothetical protein
MRTVSRPLVNAAHYTYRVTWSAEDGEYVASCLEFPSLSWLDASRTGAIDGLEKVVAERRFSGTFNVRIGEQLHRVLVMRAAEEHMSLNQYVVKMLASGRTG